MREITNESIFLWKKRLFPRRSKKKDKKIEASLDRRVSKQMSNKEESFDFKLLCEEPSLVKKFFLFIRGK